MTTNTIEERLRIEHPNGKITVSETESSGPYKIYDVVIRKKMMTHNADYPSDNVCLCGHLYNRHFDSYEDWEAVGCKYCGCNHFVHDLGQRLSPFVRMQQFGQWNVQLEDYMLQWDLLGYAQYSTLADYLGATLKEWVDFQNPLVPRKGPTIQFEDVDEYTEVL